VVLVKTVRTGREGVLDFAHEVVRLRLFFSFIGKSSQGKAFSAPKISNSLNQIELNRIELQ
jgi:hypothetical protein